MDLKPVYKATCSRIPCQIYRFIEAPSQERAIEALYLLGWTPDGACAKCAAVVR